MGKAAYWTIVAATLLVYGTMLAWTLPAISAAAGGLPAFDMRPAGYGLAEAQAFLSALSSEGLSLYRNVQLRLDIAFPALLSATIGFAILFLIPRKLGVARWIASSLAIFPAVFDYLENAGITAMLDAGPAALSESLVADTSRWSVLKSTSSAVAMSILLLALVWRAIVAFRKPRAA